MKIVGRLTRIVISGSENLMTPNRVIYIINQSPELLKAWRELSETQKRAVIRACEIEEDDDVGRIIEEVSDGQRRLF